MVNIGQLSSIKATDENAYVFQIVSEETYNKTKKFLEKNNLNSGYALQFPDGNGYYVYIGRYNNGKFETVPEINRVSNSSVNEFNTSFDAAIKTAKVPERQAQLIENAIKGENNYFTLATTEAAVTQESSGSVALGAVEPTETSATTEVAATTAATPATPTPAPESLDAAQVGFWNSVSEIPENLRSAELTEKLKQIKEEYPEQVAAESLTQKEYDALSATQKVGIQQRAYALNKSFKKPTKTASGVTGYTILLADPCKDDFFAEVEAKLNNFFKKITKLGGKLLNMGEEIKTIVGSIFSFAKKFISKIANLIADKISGLIKGAISGLSDLLPGMVDVTNAFFGAIKCLLAKIGDALEKTIEDLIIGMVKNVINAPRCAIEQFMGAMMSKVTSLIDSALGPVLGKIQDVFGFVFKIRDFVLSAISAARKISNLFKCDDKQTCPASSKYIIDKGSVKDDDEGSKNKSLNNVMDALDAVGNLSPSAAVSQGLSNWEKDYGSWGIFGDGGAEGVPDILGDCNTGNVFECGLPKIEFFGGGGSGAAGKVLMGNFLSNVDPDDIYGDIKRSGGIVGVEMSIPGEGYTSPPLVSFSDGCEQGYGAYGRAIVDTNINSPTYGEVTSVVILSSGENYPVGDIEEVYINNLVIEDSGENYADDDVPENEDIEVTIVDGRIISARITKQIEYTTIPEININTITGYGARIKPIMGLTRKPQEELVQVIDCVS